MVPQTGVSPGVSPRSAWPESRRIEPFRRVTGAEGLSAPVKLIEQRLSRDEIGRLGVKVPSDPLARTAQDHIEVRLKIVTVSFRPVGNFGKRAQGCLEPVLVNHLTS